MREWLTRLRSPEDHQIETNSMRSAGAWVSHAQKADEARLVLLHETAVATLAFLACVLAAAVISEMTHPPMGPTVPMMDWPAGAL
jgi:hypothetical protein